MEEETWKTHPVLGIEVSNKGRVVTCRGKHITYGCDRGDGYKVVGFKKKMYLVHRLVAEAFIENPHHLPCVNHKDENPSNNNIENLEWCTYQYNTNYGTCQKRKVAHTDYKAIAAKIDYKAIAAKIDYKARTANTDYKARTANTDWKAKVAHTDYKAIAEKRSKPVYQYTKDGILVNTWCSTAECGRNGFHQSDVSKCCNGKLPHYKGYIWSYEEKG